MFQVVFAALALVGASIHLVVSPSRRSNKAAIAATYLYGRTGYSSYVRVDLKQDARIQGVNLHFSSPNAILKLKAINKSSRLPVGNARIHIGWFDDPQITPSADMGKNGMFVMVLPRHKVSITVSAPVLDSWRYQDYKTGASYLLETSNSQVNIVAELEPSSIHSP